MSVQMMELHRRNGIMVKLLVGCLVLGIAASYESLHTILILIACGVPITGVCMYLTWKKQLIPYTKYVIAIGFNIISYFFMETEAILSNALILFLGLALVSLYLDYRPLLLNGIIGIINLNYFCSTLSGNVDYIGVNAFYVLTIVTLIGQSFIGSRMLRNVVKSSEESEFSRLQTEQVLVGVRETTEVLGTSSNALQENASITGKITNEVAAAFHEISLGIESQATSITDITSAMQDVNETVVQTSSASRTMSSRSRDTAQMTNQGKTQMEDLSLKINDITQIVIDTSQIMNAVNEENRQISNIVSTIADIANQTNLLSLNASIEAARAGEQGKGFSVVANEIRKLAQNAHVASTDISEILGSIQNKVESAVEKVTVGLEAVDSGKNSAESVSRLFEVINNNTAEVMEQAESLQRMNVQLQASSQKVAEEMTSVAAITEQSAASVQEVLASAEVQQKRVEDIVNSIRQLNGLTQNLQQLVE
ncbi:methyl-accepting chemotaxis protein [Paenibacillus sp. SYP-B3998]|uniref:Methyl-accepting chemotaxis protein n=1 Tax=Paenibacillus sp. SYP-B3998 TaxID=2678564 RepID=A0A6G4A2A1_9BACL|nr:methyl-accepting chemotaxis protein [Paenibacillus sp. SYP-B3998]NEW07949.1 methyl-accepting chemotaxis protein [Paenibacillus sp. SYP-B3998]